MNFRSFQWLTILFSLNNSIQVTCIKSMNGSGNPNYNAARECDDRCLILIFCLGGGGLIFLIAAYFIRRKRLRIQNQEKEQQIKQEEEEFLRFDLHRINESTLMLLDKIYPSLINRTWILEQESHQKTQQIKFFEPYFAINEADVCMDIRADGDDIKGAWKGKGHIKYAENKWKLFMSKAYLNREKAGQIGTFSMIIYEGDFTDDLSQCSGEWWVKNHRGHPDHRGYWQMNAKPACMQAA